MDMHDGLTLQQLRGLTTGDVDVFQVFETPSPLWLLDEGDLHQISSAVKYER